MSVNVLDKLFKPEAIVLVGASNRPMSVGSVIMKNLLEGGFKGNIFAVNPKGEVIHGEQSYKTIAELPKTPDLAVLAIRPSLVPETLEQLAEKGTKAVIIIAAGLNVKDEGMDKTHQELALEIAHKNGMRLMGPNCLGLLVPHMGVNASFSCSPALEGHIAFISQSGALCVSVLDWAKPKNIGFSYFASIGDAADLNFDDMLEYLADDPKTNAIFMYVESIKNREKFMKAALAASKKKPVFAIKSGRVPEGAAAAASHTGALAGGDDVYDAAFLRAGVVRLEDLEDMYAAILFLEYRNKVKDEKVTILTNGGGPGVLAVDGLIKSGGKLTKISDETKKKLDEVLPSTWSHGNPVDIIGDAPGARYADALKVLLDAPEVGEILVMYVPTGISSGSEVAEKVLEVETERKSGRIFGCWVGGDVVMPGIKMFNDNRLPCFESGERGVKGFMYLNNFYKLRAQRDEQDVVTTPLKPVDKEKVRGIFDAVMAEGRSMLTEAEAKQVFEAYNIPVVRTRIAANPAEAKKLAEEIGATVALKILSNDISHKSDAGGVALNLKTPEEVEKAAEEMLERIGKNFPDAKLDGFTVQEMVMKKNPHEVIVGVTTDPIFGPVIMVGQGGTAVELVKDTAIALPPLNKPQALDAISRTKIFKLMEGYRDRPAADLDALVSAMMQIGQLVVDFEEVTELDANPLFVDENGAIAVDARIVVKKYDSPKHRLAML
ncbi:MAG: acetate--CoA ligase family protein [Alphaproteobacteria bacterium]|nr:acetate--CoA ligase family protein [Alphaproteobacteria bacterium]